MANLLQYRIFILAIAISLLWHVFWLSAVRIVSVPPEKGAVKFSKVSFLGPFLKREAISLRVQPKERTFLEKRYRDVTGSFVDKAVLQQEIVSYKYGPNGKGHILTDRRLINFIDEALGGPKEEPNYHE